jgi:hypothetical protein
MLSTLVLSNEKPPPLCVSIGGGSMSLVVNTYDMKIRKTVEGKEAIMKDKRFYVAHLDYDTIIEELDATAIIKGLK